MTDFRFRQISLCCLLLTAALTGSAALVARAAPAAPPAYTITDLGLLPTCSDDIAPGLDSAGNISGWTAAGDRPAQATVRRAGGPPTILGVLPGYPVMYATAVSGGLVSGVARTTADLRPCRAFVWRAGHLRDLGTLGGKYASAHALNTRGQVAGYAQTPLGETRAALWPAGAGAAISLGTLGGDYSIANGINNFGEVVGASNILPNGKVHGFLWHAGRMRDLGTLPFGPLSSARAVNASGEIVGWGELPGGEMHAVLWRGSRCADLGTLGDDPSAAWDISDRGQIVGTSAIKEGKMRAFLWQKGTMRDLNTLIPAGTGWVLLAAYRINERGWIVGRGFLRGESRGFLLTPLNSGKKIQKP